jgi:hypothetical protein
VGGRGEGPFSANTPFLPYITRTGARALAIFKAPLRCIYEYDTSSEYEVSSRYDIIPSRYEIYANYEILEG